MAKKDCIEILKNSSPGIHKYLEEKNGIYDGSESSKKAYIKAAKELQENSLNTIHDIFSQVGVSGYKKLPATEIKKTETDKPTIEEPAPVSTVVGDKKPSIDEEGKIVVDDKKDFSEGYPYLEVNRVTEYDKAKDLHPLEKIEWALWRKKQVETQLENKREEKTDNKGVKWANKNAQGFKSAAVKELLAQRNALDEYIKKQLPNSYDTNLKDFPKYTDAEKNRLVEDGLLPKYANEKWQTVEPKLLPITNKEVQPSIKNEVISPELKTIQNDLNVGDNATFKIGNKLEKGEVKNIEVDKFKGKVVVDFIDEAGNERFGYLHQVINVEAGQRKLPKSDNFTEEQRSRYNKLLNQDELSAKELDELGKLGEIKRGEVQPSIENKPSIAEKGKDLADRIRQLKTKHDKLQTNIFGIPIAVYDGAIESVATAVENGAKLAEAIQSIIKDIRDTHVGFQENDFIKHIEDFAAGEKPKIRVQVGEEKPEGDLTGIKHEATEELRRKYNLGDYKRENSTDAELEALADEAIKKGYNPETLIAQMEAGTPPTGVENFILKKYLSTLEAKFDKNPTDENLAPIERLVKATDKIGSLQSEAFRTRKGLVPVDDSLAGYFIKEKEVNLNAPLTDNQKATVKKEYADISEAQKEYDVKIAALEAENTRLIAEAEIKKTVSKKPATTTKRTHEDFVKERRNILDNIQKKLKKARGEVNVTPVPYAKELVTIAPDVLKLVKNLVEEGVIKLSDIVADIHDSLRYTGITKNDIHNIIAGEYNEKKQSRSEIAKQIFELKQEAQLINKYDKLENGIEPKNEKDKIKRNQELEALRNKIKEHDLTKLADYKSKTKSKIEKLEEDLRTGNYFKPEPIQPIKLDKEALDAKDKLIKLKNERHFRILMHQHKNMSTREKAITGFAEVLNIPRTLMTIVDYSAMLRQGLIQTVSHPLLASEAAKKMLQAGASQKIYDRWFYDLKETPRFQLMENSKLGITDSTNPLLSAREEGFMSNLAEKIPIIGKTLNIGGVKIPGTNLVKGSERAYSMFLNKLRVDVFNRFADAMEERGLTYENSPKQFEQMAEYVNNSTGRGSLGSTLNKIAPILNSLLFSPRLIASRLNMLTYLAQPRFYKTVPKEVRIAYFKDMAKFIGVGMTVLALASLGGGDDKKNKTTVETDPRSPDFGKIKNKNTRWDIWGGFQQYIRVSAQAWMGERKRANGKISKLDGKHAFGEDKTDVLLGFGRSKLAPVPAIAVDLFSGRTQIGDRIIFDTGKEKYKEITIDRYLKEHLLPLTFTGLEDAVKDQGIKSLITVGVPSVFGVGTQTYDNKKKK